MIKMMTFFLACCVLPIILEMILYLKYPINMLIMFLPDGPGPATIGGAVAGAVLLILIIIVVVVVVMAVRRKKATERRKFIWLSLYGIVKFFSNGFFSLLLCPDQLFTSKLAFKFVFVVSGAERQRFVYKNIFCNMDLLLVQTLNENNGIYFS